MTAPERWDAARVRQLFRDTLPGRNLVVVSNREPYQHVWRDSEVRVDRPAGGLTAALDPVLQGIGGTWVAWGSGDADRAVSANGIVWVPPENPGYRLKRVWLSPREVRGYYEGYSNRVLWPLCHLLIERVDLSEAWWKHYAQVNRRFAVETAGVARPGDVVWVHDYQLALVPLFLRSRCPRVLICSFWHIPWPPHAAFRFCPQASQIIKGLLGCDLIGFQTPEYAVSFLECVEKELGDACQVSYGGGGPDPDSGWVAGRVRWQHGTVAVGAFPISIDYDAFAAMALSRDALAAARRILRRLGLAAGAAGVRLRKGNTLQPLALGIAVDRLDYTKGILERLAALDRFFSDNPHYREKVAVVQVVAPSRTGIPDYRRLREQVSSMVDELNQRHRTEIWQPVYSIDHKLGPVTLAGLYRLADFAIVSSVYDGMNLVAKEFVAARSDGDGVLLLSKTAGAAAELEQAIPINPLDPAGFAAAIRTALEMPAEERRRRMAALRAYISEHNIYHWVASFLRALGSLPAASSAPVASSPAGADVTQPAVPQPVRHTRAGVDR